MHGGGSVCGGVFLGSVVVGVTSRIDVCCCLSNSVEGFSEECTPSATAAAAAAAIGRCRRRSFTVFLAVAITVTTIATPTTTTSSCACAV